MLSTSAAQSSAVGHALASRAPSRPSRLPTPAARRLPCRRSMAAPAAAVDPAALYVAYQAQQFGITLIGMGLVTALASGSQLVLQRAGAGADRAAPAAAPAAQAPAPAQRVKAPNADSLVSAMVTSSPLTAAAPFAIAVPTPSAPTAAALSLGDIKSELQQAAADAVAAIKTAAEGTPERAAPAPVATPAPRTSEPNGSAVNPRLTVQEATRQVQDWIAAWRTTDGQGEADAEPADAAAKAAPAGGPEPPREEEETAAPAEPAVDAAAVLAELTADAPVAATPVGAPEVAAPPAEPAEPVVQLASAQKQAGPAPGEGATAERAAEYKERLGRVVADSKLAPAGAAAAKAGPTFSGYKEKIAGLWEQYQAKQAREQELLAKSERILQSLAEAEAAEQAQQEAVVAAAVEQRRQGVLALLLARLLALFQAVKAFVQQLVGRLGGGSGGAAAGASA